jgi:hypothetical protein
MSAITQGHFARTPEGVELTLRRGKQAETRLFQDFGELLVFLATSFAAPVRPDPPTPTPGTPEISVARAA